jgi:hypothetical protein
VFVTSDSDRRTGVAEVNLEIVEEIERFFKAKTYGAEVAAVVIVMMCRDPVYEFKQRIRFSKAEQTFYLDVMLDWNEMIHAGTRRKPAALRTVRQTVRNVLEKRKWKSFDVTQFLLDFDTICERLSRS